MTKRPIDRLRAICLALSETAEKEAWGDPTFRVRDKILRWRSGATARFGLAESAPGIQTMQVEINPDRLFVPPYVGPKGWIGIRLDNDPDRAVADQIKRSYTLIAPNRLAAKVDD